MVFSFVAVNTPKIQKTQKPLILQGIFRQKKKAGDGNRTHVSSLEGWVART